MQSLLQQACDLHATSIVVDGHADTPQRFADEDWQWTDADLRGGQISADTALQGGLDAEFFALWAEPGQWAGNFEQRTLALLEAVELQIERYPQALQLCTNAAHVRSAKSAGRFAALLGIEGGHSIGTDLDLLRHFHARGVRYMTLTWSNTNAWCDSSNDREVHRGLTPFGGQVVREMNRLGMLVDVSHVSDAAFSQVLDIAKAPVIASHSSARALTPSPRNLTDDQLRAVATSGGVVMVNFFNAFVSESFRTLWNEGQTRRETTLKEASDIAQRHQRPFHFSNELAIDRDFALRLPRPPLSALLQHFDHVLRVCGIDHVGIGSDFDGIPLAPQGIDSAADLPQLTAGLLAMSWKPQELKGLLGENILRVLDEAQA